MSLQTTEENTISNVCQQWDTIKKCSENFPKAALTCMISGFTVVTVFIQTHIN